MKMNENILKKLENLNGLKTLALTASALSVVFALSTLYLAMKDPIIIERNEEVLNVKVKASSERTKAELEGFLKASLSARFDTNPEQVGNLAKSFLSLQMLKARELEQIDLKKGALTQKILFDSIVSSSGGLIVKVDRLVKTKSLSSVFPLLFKVKLDETARSGENPYGLVLREVTQVKTKKVEEE